MLKWLAFAIVLAPVWAGLGLAIWEDLIQPRLIPQAEIERLADELMAQSSNPEIIALTNIDRAWRYSDGREAGKWRRVHRAIRRRLCERAAAQD